MTLKRRLAAALLATTSLCLPNVAIGQIVASGATHTTVTNAANGVPVVNIATPNAAGLSHNKYNDFNVDNRGVVLNNSTTDAATRQSQLAGQVTSNANIGTTAAKVILNEVTSTNRSVLNGFTEVLGGKADVIVANPNGITCGGCGFINAPNVTMTTGRPTLDANGQLTGFGVTGGDILITGNGLNATAQDYLALVARRIVIQAPVNATLLDVVGGSNDWNMATRTATARAGADATPAYAIDSALLGGMYANRVRLIVTEAGAGVRMAGDMAASAGDFTINAAGRVEMLGALSASGRIAVTSTGGGVALSGAKVTAGSDLSLGAGTGAVTLSGGTLTAATTLALTGASLTDTAVASSAADANKRYGASGVTLALTGAAGIDGTNWGSAGSLGLTAGSVTASGATLYANTLSLRATAGDLALGSASLKAAGALGLTASGALSTSGAVQSTGGYITLGLGGFAGTGTISADAGAVAITATGTASNSGTIQAQRALTISGGTWTNSGALRSAQALSVTAAALSSSGTIGGQSVAATVTGALGNSGTIAASTSATFQPRRCRPSTSCSPTASRSPRAA